MANTLKFGNGEWYGKKDTILAYNDENSNYKPLLFDFSRASKATRVNKDGLIEEVGSGQPRVDYLNNTKGAMLLEPSRTNLVSYSEDFNLLVKKNNAVVTSNATLSPSGSLNADEITFDGTAYGRVEAVVPATVGQTYTISLYLKNKDLSDKTQVWIGFSQSSQGGYVTITDEWQRYDITTNADGTTEYPRIQFSGTGSLYAWGFQTEQQSYATSYIPTNGSAVTRVADSCSQTVQDGVIGQTEGSVFLDITRDGLESYTQRVLTLSNGTTNNVIGLQLTAANQITFYVENGGSNQVVITKSNATTENVNVKIGVSYKANDFVMYIDGVQVGVDTSGSVPTTSVIKYANPSGSLQYVGVVNNFKLYNTRLSNSELQALTQV